MLLPLWAECQGRIWKTLPGVLVKFFLSPHKIYLFLLILLPTGACEGRVRSSCVVLCCQLMLQHYKPQIPSAEAAGLKLHCCCLSRADGPAVGAEQPLSARCCPENAGKVAKEDAAWQGKAKDNATERIKVPLSQLYLRGG